MISGHSWNNWSLSMGWRTTATRLLGRIRDLTTSPTRSVLPGFWDCLAGSDEDCSPEVNEIIQGLIGRDDGPDEIGERIKTIVREQQRSIANGKRSGARK